MAISTPPHDPSLLKVHLTGLYEDISEPIKGTFGSQGVFWVVAKVNNGDKYSIFKVRLHGGPNVSGRVLAFGDDREPCYQISTSGQPNDE
jgi:hypothetical protein